MKNNITQIIRQEEKYLINSEDKTKLIKALDENLYPGFFDEVEEYKVRSVYFDSLDDQDYHNKSDIFGFMKKIRLRTYSPEDETGKFEFKRKYMDQGEVKDSLIISKNHVNEIIKGNFEVFKNYKEPIAKFFHEILISMHYRPVSLVQYQRKAYTNILPGTRITFDSDLEFRNHNFTLFSDDGEDLIKVLDEDKSILELKYKDHLLPEIQTIIEEITLEPSFLNKYTASRSMEDNP